MAGTSPAMTRGDSGMHYSGLKFIATPLMQ